MSRSQCVCGDCAEDFGHISQIDGEYTDVWIIHTLTKKLDDAGYYEGDECEFDHNHETSKSCSLVYKCDDCGEAHEDRSDAEGCCPKWECNFCGWKHSGSYWNNAKDAAASCCAQTCDDCEAYGWPDYIAEHTCNTGMGMRKTLPWEERGIKVSAAKPEGGRDWQQVWGLNPEEHDVVQAAADYYLLEAMKAGLVGTVDAERDRIFSEEKGEWVELPKPNTAVANHTLLRILRDEAEQMFNDLVRTWDPILQAYTHMACGGELRHHVAVGGGNVLNSDRDTAWNGWKQVFEVVGPDALVDAAALFREFEGGSFGGDPWAQACEILHARITGKIGPALFLDRIFNAQHNGGVLLNKVNWKGEAQRYTTGHYLYSVSELQSRLLPAHGEEPEPDYSTLLAYASTKVRALFSDFFEYGRRARLDMGMSLVGLPTKPATGDTQRGAYNRAQQVAAAKAAAYAAMPKSEQFKVKAQEYDAMIAQYQPYADTEAKANARIKAKIDAGEKPVGACQGSCCKNVSLDFSYYEQTYYTNIVAEYVSAKDKMLAKAAQWAAYEAGDGNKPSTFSAYSSASW